jgi:molybdopterin adenylyltransferase
MERKPKAPAEFRPLRMAVLTVSDRRTRADDVSGDTLQGRVEAAGHVLAERDLVPDDVYAIRAVASAWIARPDVEVVLITGGTGVTGRDLTPEAIRPLLDKEIPGFGELFRAVSAEELGTAAYLSRAFAGTANATLLFGLPGSPGACRTAWDRILSIQLDARTMPCNFVFLMPRLGER